MKKLKLHFVQIDKDMFVAPPRRRPDIIKIGYKTLAAHGAVLRVILLGRRWACMVADAACLVADAATLHLVVIFIIVPFYRVSFDIVPYMLIIFNSPNYMVMKRTLPH